MCKLLQLITIFHWILECCRRCFRGTDNEAEHLLDAEAPGQAEDNECETKVVLEPRLVENNAESNSFQRELQTLREDRKKLQSEVETRLAQVQEKDAEISRQQKELLKLREDRQRLQTEMEAKDTQLQQKDGQIQQQDTELREKATQISRQQRELQTLTDDREKLQGEVEAKLAQLQEKDVEIKRLQRELQILKEKQHQKDNEQHQDIKVTAEPPKVISQPTNQTDILPGEAVKFSVQATGAQPLEYRWERKWFGKEGEQDGWKDLPAKDNTFQIMEVKAHDAGYYRCVVSNGAASETSQCVSLTVVPELRDLDNELQSVTDWLPFGLNLGLKSEELKTIEVNHPNDLKRRRFEVLTEWRKKVTPTWSGVAQALMNTGMRRLASKLAKKHGAPPPELADDDVLERLHVTNILQQKEVTGSKLLKEVEKRRGPLEQDCRMLADAEKQLRHSRKSKSAVNEVFSQVMCRLKELHRKVQKIAQERNILKMELDHKQRELQLLYEMKEKFAPDVEKNSFYSAKISKKRLKIKKLEKKLQRKKSELHSAMQEANKLQEELLQAQVKLKEKHEEVKQLHEEKEKLSCSFSIEREQVSKLVQLITTLTSEKEEMKQQLSSIKEESESRWRQIESCKLNINRLSEEVKQKEATVAQLKSELQSANEQFHATPEQLLEILELNTQIAELEHRLQEVKEEKQQEELDKEAAVQEVDAMKEFIQLLCEKLDEAPKIPSSLHEQFDQPPKITSPPISPREIIPGKPVTFTVQATGTKPLAYQWQWKPAKEDGKWQSCPPTWSDGATLTISNPQKSNEGWYSCAISNSVGEKTSRPAKLSFAEPPKITTHPKDLKNFIGKPASFRIQATGTGPLTYQWQWIRSEKVGNKDWQPCDAKWSGNGTTLTIPIVQKSNEGSYRCVVSNHVGNVTSNSATLETCPLQLPLQLRWGRSRDMVYGMSEYPHTVVLHTYIYVGGGLADDVDEECTIQVFDTNKAVWNNLPRYRYRWFAMIVVNSQLTLVGGKDVSNWKVTNQLAVFDPTSQCWRYPYPPMPTPRHRPAVSTYDIWLLVAGGGDRRDLATVELLNISTKQWLSASPLPMPCSRMSSTVLEDKWYLVTNSKKVFCVSLPDIVSQAVSRSTATKLPALWSHLPDTPLGYSTAIVLHGSLLAVGGYDNGARTDIYLYHPVNKKWAKVVDLPSPRYYCSCVLLPNGKLLVAGGEEIFGRTRRVDVAWTL